MFASTDFPLKNQKFGITVISNVALFIKVTAC